MYIYSGKKLSGSSFRVLESMYSSSKFHPKHAQVIYKTLNPKP